MLELLKYIRGYLRIRVYGFSPERFINLCSNKDILLWDIGQENDGYVMCISLRSFYKLKPITRKTRTRVVILERCGLPFLMPLIQKRWVFLAGAFLAVGFWYLSGWFVWDISVSGNYRITTDQMETFLTECGIREGMRKEALNIGELEKAIRRRFPAVTWTSVKLDGTKLLVYIKENDAPILDTERSGQETAGTDLTAEFEGTVVEMVVRSGVPRVKIGDVVEKGTILVDGKVPVYNEDATLREYIVTDADADVIIERMRDCRASLPYDYIEREYTGRVRRQPFVCIGDGFECKIPLESPFLIYDRVMRQSRPLLFEKLGIPVSVGSYTYREYQNVEHKYTAEEAERLLNKKLLLFLQTLEEKGVQIIEKNVKIDASDSCWILYGEFLVREPAGKRTATDRGEEISEK